jgi:hypothetical protein
LPACTDPIKVYGAPTQHSTDAVCQAAKWLKSSVEKLSEKLHERAKRLSIKRLIAT